MIGKKMTPQGRTRAFTDEELLVLIKQHRNPALTFEERMRTQEIRARVNALRNLPRSAI